MPQRNNKPHVVFVLPTYNESDNIPKLLPKLMPVLKQQKDYVFSILFVDDNSPDGTQQEIKKQQKKYSNIHLLTGKKKGLGAAYVKGMRYAIDKMNADILFEMDSDLSHDPKEIPQFLNAIEQGADYVVGSRYMPGGSIPKNWGFDRKLYSFLGNIIVRAGLMIPRLREWSSGYRALKKEVFQEIEEGLDGYVGYTFQIASLHRVYISGYTILEVPIQFTDRKYGESKFDVMDYAPNVLSYIVTNSSFIRFVVTGLFGFGVDFGIASMLVFGLAVYEPIANALSAAVAITTNFLINNFWSFSYKKIQGGARTMAKKYAQFIVVAIGSVFIQGVGMYLALSYFGDTILDLFGITFHSWILYKVLIIGFLIIPYSYIMYNKIIWKKTA